MIFGWDFIILLARKSFIFAPSLAVFLRLLGGLNELEK